MLQNKVLIEGQMGLKVLVWWKKTWNIMVVISKRLYLGVVISVVCVSNDHIELRNTIR